ncbi:hypothetical protein PsorP6_013935 [Peronosclerospora sorghi]|uniref:Uncharacterized protein n=1 Tax=Peronosclerospora sorghi TaxID=230839 RepID=A0ACC0VII3_9STRA|nr:hypothetical protein PsorP6_013935 [Peronosclerospora sorghi]
MPTLFERCIALKEIHKYQKSTGLLIPWDHFDICVVKRHQIGAIRDVLEALQEGAESFLVKYFEHCNLAAIHTKHVTIMDKDAKFLENFEKL